MVLAGRGWGKTRSGAEWVLEGALSHPSSDWAVVAPTFGAARDVCAEGPGGILAVARPGEVVHYVRSLGEIRLSNGSRIFTRSADEPDRLRGFNLSGAWCDELALFRYPAVWYEALVPAVRHPPARICVTTTPRPTGLLKDLLGRRDGSVVVSRGRTWENAANLSATALTELQARYEGTRLGRQELEGELLEDVEGALWTLSMFDDSRVETAPELERVVVGVDPSVSAQGTGDETGIVVAGIADRGQDARYYVLADASLSGSPHAWALKVASVYDRHRADRVVVEVDQGGGLVEDTLRAVDANLPVRTVNAKRSKQLRAEPIVALYERGKVHHVGILPQLEEQMTTWVPGIGRSPDRVDALVYALTGLAEPARRKRRMMRYAKGERVPEDPGFPAAATPLEADAWPTGPSPRQVRGM